MKSKSILFMALATSLMLQARLSNAQTWNMVGNTNLTATSKMGGTSATAAQNFPLSLWTYNAERIHINANVTSKVGYVGIGTAAPATRLHVNGVITATGGTSTNWNLAYTRVPAGSTSRVPRWGGTSYLVGSIYDNGTNVGIGGLNTGYALNVIGSASLNGINVADGGISSNSTTGVGVSGTGGFYGIYGNSTSSSGYGVVGQASGTSGTGVFGSGYYGIYGSSSNYGVYGSGASYGVYGISTNNFGVYGNSGYIGVYGEGSSYGVYGRSINNYGVFGSSNAQVGTYGYSSNYQGGHFESSNNNALWAKTNIVAAGIYAGVFEGSVYTYGTYSASDRNLKKNIEDVDNAMSIINKLKPKNYEFRNDGKYAALNLPKGNHYGLIAQELEEVLPELVAAAPRGLGLPADKPSDPKNPTKEIATAEQNEANAIPDTKAINYTELIPIMIKAMQEQQQQIELLKTENAQMQQDLQSCCLNHSSENANKTIQQDANDKVVLEQNMPNPFNHETTIRYYLPAGNSAVLKVISLDGKEILTRLINKTGFGEIIISGSSLEAGSYTYALLVNGKVVASKIMVLTK